MSVNEIQFPLSVSQWNKTVRYSTDIMVGRNGQEVRNALWQDPLLKFNAAFSVKNASDVSTLENFFHAMRGREQAFLVKDWADYSISTATQSSNTADGTRTTFQIVKRYPQTNPAGNTEYIRSIKYLSSTAGNVVARVNGSVTTAFTVNNATGIVTFTSPPPNGQSVTFTVTEFYVPCRFDIDELPLELLYHFVSKQQYDIPDIPLVEVRV